jgi:hypothetical protein
MPKIDNSIKGDMAVKLIAELGGVVATAKLCQIASSSVCSWKRMGVPRARVMFLQLKRPDLKIWKEIEV